MENGKRKMENERQRVPVIDAGSKGMDLSLKGTKTIAQGKAEGRNPGYTGTIDPLPEGEQPRGVICIPVSAGITSSRSLLFPERFSVLAAARPRFPACRRSACRTEHRNKYKTGKAAGR